MSEQQPVGERQIRRGRADNSTQLDPLKLMVAAFGEAGGWRVDRHPRFVVQRPDGRVEIVGFADDGVWVSRAQPDGGFAAPDFLFANFGYDAGWRVEHHPRLVADITNDGRVVGFRGDGVPVPHAQQR
jgi:hypothetical protein